MHVISSTKGVRKARQRMRRTGLVVRETGQGGPVGLLASELVSGPLGGDVFWDREGGRSNERGQGRGKRVGVGEDVGTNLWNSSECGGTVDRRGGSVSIGGER